MRRYIGLDVLAKTRLTILHSEATTTEEVLPAAITA
jgi:hypothetical protein